MTRPRLTIVVSPLIALMKDQVTRCRPAAFRDVLNSSLTPNESRSRLRGLHEGQFRLLYVARNGCCSRVSWRRCGGWNVRLLPLTSALHQRMGHDFRPEYAACRLARAFPGRPADGLTATATDACAPTSSTAPIGEPRAMSRVSTAELTYRVLANATVEQSWNSSAPAAGKRDCLLPVAQGRESVAWRLTRTA